MTLSFYLNIQIMYYKFQEYFTQNHFDRVYIEIPTWNLLSIISFSSGSKNLEYDSIVYNSHYGNIALPSISTTPTSATEIVQSNVVAGILETPPATPKISSSHVKQLESIPINQKQPKPRGAAAPQKSKPLPKTPTHGRSRAAPSSREGVAEHSREGVVELETGEKRELKQHLEQLKGNNKTALKESYEVCLNLLRSNTVRDYCIFQN